jgi:Fe-S-cluster containining protein
MSALFRLHEEIAGRVRQIREDQADWLCAKGCDHCCRHLADIPQLTAAEWDCLAPALAALSATQRRTISQKMAAMADQTTPPWVCPLLDTASGACMVYAERPIACRTYGFYVQRDQGLYCHDIAAAVDRGELPDVVWGNHDSIDRRLTDLGEKRPLSDWFAATPETDC